MTGVVGADVERMRTALFIEAPWSSRSSSRFWVLLVLAAVIATAGVVADSTATVIGAMIVAPLMTPILGIALSVVLADRGHLVRSVLLVLGGSLLVVAIAYLIGSTSHPVDAYLSNSQVSGRISPRLIDLMAALATGTVGAFALVRSDISDTLPGVAIAISLVPPLAVVGLLLQVGRYGDAAGAGLLFATNVAAIVATGTIVLLLYRVRDAAVGAGLDVGHVRGTTLAVIAGLVVAVVVPLGVASRSLAADVALANQARPVAERWAAAAGWQVTVVDAVSSVVTVTALGPPPTLDPALLRRALNDNGMSDAGLTIRLVVGGTRYCAAGGTTCTAAAPGS
jgi:uncharacterized hydrophobic protein (TIGR00271 family)